MPAALRQASPTPSPPAVDVCLPQSSPSASFISATCVEIDDLLLQGTDHSSEVRGNFESRLLVNTLNDSIEANRRSLVVRAPKVCKTG